MYLTMSVIIVTQPINLEIELQMSLIFLHAVKNILLITVF